jgi:hypothetical protein
MRSSAAQHFTYKPAGNRVTSRAAKSMSIIDLEAHPVKASAAHTEDRRNPTPAAESIVAVVHKLKE